MHNYLHLILIIAGGLVLRGRKTAHIVDCSVNALLTVCPCSHLQLQEGP